jgi:hypothetical protein
MMQFSCRVSDVACMERGKHVADRGAKGVAKPVRGIRHKRSRGPPLDAQMMSSTRTLSS